MQRRKCREYNFENLVFIFSEIIFFSKKPNRSCMKNWCAKNWFFANNFKSKKWDGSHFSCITQFCSVQVLCVPFSVCALLHDEGATKKSVWSLHLGAHSSLNVVHDHCKHNEPKNLKSSQLVITRLRCLCLLHSNINHAGILHSGYGELQRSFSFYKSLNAYSLSLCI